MVPDISLMVVMKKDNVKVDLYRTSLFPEIFGVLRNGEVRYRVRIDGEWVQGEACFTLTKILMKIRTWVVERRGPRMTAKGRKYKGLRQEV